MTITGDDPKKFAAAMVEYSKEKVGGVQLWFLIYSHHVFRISN